MTKDEIKAVLHARGYSMYIQNYVGRRGNGTSSTSISARRSGGRTHYIATAAVLERNNAAWLHARLDEIEEAGRG